MHFFHKKSWQPFFFFSLVVALKIQAPNAADCLTVKIKQIKWSDMVTFIFIFCSHYYRSKATGRAEDLPARSFDLARPGVAPPLETMHISVYKYGQWSTKRVFLSKFTFFQKTPDCYHSLHIISTNWTAVMWLPTGTVCQPLAFRHLLHGQHHCMVKTAARAPITWCSDNHISDRINDNTTNCRGILHTTSHENYQYKQTDFIKFTEQLKDSSRN